MDRFLDRKPLFSISPSKPSSLAGEEMSSSEPPAGDDDGALHQHFCPRCTRTITMDPSAEGILVCPICHEGLTEESDLPSSSSNPRSLSLNPNAAPFFPFSHSTPTELHRMAMFEHRRPTDRFLHVTSESEFFRPPYASSEDVLPTMPSAGSVISFEFLFSYIHDCVSDGAAYIFFDNDSRSTDNIHRLIQQYLEVNRNCYGTLPAPQSAIASLVDAKMTEDLLASNESKCPVCIEDFNIEQEVKQMPCKHVYHKHCIVPWLEMHNSCPVCRYQLKTDYTDYEVQSGVSNQQLVQILVSDDSSEEMAGSTEQNTEGMSLRPRALGIFGIELVWPAEGSSSEFVIINSGDGQESGGGGEGNVEDSGGQEASGSQEQDISLG